MIVREYIDGPSVSAAEQFERELNDETTELHSWRAYHTHITDEPVTVILAVFEELNL